MLETWNMPYCADKCFSDASMIEKTHAAAIIDVIPRNRSVAWWPFDINIVNDFRGAPALIGQAPSSN